ncbi:MAG TPA: hypothetical protein VFT58_02430, partial [Nitrososphaera sp.]|nr:hypothetical protein [Nitrososphaera sp.]
MRYLSATLESPISLSYEVDPEMVCGGVWVEDEKRFVPVAPRRNANGGIDVYNDAEFGHSIIDYVEVGPDGAPLAEERVRANVLSVPAGHSSPAWEIKGTAEGYDEYHYTVEGNGDFSHWVPDGQDGKERTDTPL